MTPTEEKLRGCVASVRRITGFVPRVALILGSGLGDYADSGAVEVECRIP